MERSVPNKSAPRFTRPPNSAYSPDDDPEYARHQLVNNAIRKRLIDRLTGRGDRWEVLRGTQPSNQFFAGALSGQYEYQQAQQEDESFEHFAQDISPFTIGVTFRLPVDVDDDAVVTCSPTAAGFQRRFPTLEEQLNSANDNLKADVLFETQDGAVANASDHEDSDATDQNRQNDFEELLQVYERIPFNWDEVTITGSELKNILAQSGAKTIELDTSSAIERARSLQRQYREMSTGVSESKASSVPVSVLGEESALESYLDKHFDGDEVDPLWDAKLEIEVRKDYDENHNEEYLSVTARLVNTQGEDIDDAIDPEYEDWRATLFDIGVSVEVENTGIISFESEQIANEYQYEGSIYGTGENCAADPIIAESSDNDVHDVRGVKTKTVPTYRQPRYFSREPRDIEARMDILAGEQGRDAVFEILEGIADAMENAEDDYRDIKAEMTSGKTALAEQDFDESVEQFAAERERFEFGIKCLREDPRAYRAFTLLNQTFANMGDFEEWRLFQIIFIVMSIPDMLKQAAGVDENVDIDFTALDYDDQLNLADIIYFPTGGGKTEAYLGLVTFTAFHDRLRGKEYGMTAFTKFPLRFLSLQQLQRVANVFAEAELLRREHDIGGEEFSIGYLVGKQNTPNMLREDGVNKLRKAKEDPEFQEENLYVDTCPFCREEEVEITGDLERGRIIHQCTNDQCDETELPIYISDREVYRYSPTFVVSTIDKISIVGLQRRMRTLFGQGKIRCEKHGYAGEEQCVVDSSAIKASGECSAEDWQEVDTVEPPSLLIQDELHLLREEFGAFDSHYETFLQAYNDRVTDGEWEMKVVAATATIEGADRQVRALYQKPSNVFPSKSPRLKQSFYAYADPIRAQRNMVGAIPRSVSRTYAIEKVHEEYARTIHEYRANPESLFDDMETFARSYDISDADLPDDPDSKAEILNDVLDDYEVQVSYHYSKDNTDLLMRVLETMINQHLGDDGDPYEELRGELMTGETDLGEVREILHRLENHETVDLDPVDILIATSMISHGVDIDRLNFIGFFGLPRQTAEYIQSYSRVGRKWPGTVFLLHNPMRVRDRTYYKRFQHYQEYQDLLVEATPLERWAEFAIECTMPGIFTAALLQYYDYTLEGDLSENNRIYMFEGFADAAGILDYDEVLQFIKDSYGIDKATEGDTAGSGVEIYRQHIEQEFEKLWDACLDQTNRIPPAIANDPSTDQSNFIPLGVLDRAEDVRTPMRNLRDIDEQVTIAPDPDTSRLIKEYR